MPAVEPVGIEHIGILVEDLEAAIANWSALTGFTFSPIARYRTDRYTDASDPTPHHHDARLSFSREGPPRIELLEVTGCGTHGRGELGIHHIGLPGIDDVPARVAAMADLGVAIDGESLDEAGRILLCFTAKSALDGLRMEFISSLPSPLVADDGRELPLRPDGRRDIWAAVD